MSKVWMVRAGRGGVHVEEFLDRGYAGIGFLEQEKPIDPKATRKELAKRAEADFPNWTPPKVANVVGQVFRFFQEMKVGERIVTYDPTKRRYYIGTIESDPRTVLPCNDAYAHQRKVKWTHRVLRDTLSVATRNTLGAIMGLFLLNDQAAKDVVASAIAIDAADEVEPPPKKKKPTTDDGTTLEDLRNEVVEKAAEFIEDMIAKLDHNEMEELVAGILRGMGYKTRVSPRGADRGVDIFASPDGLGLQEPRIFVEVKHRLTTTIGSQDIRSFIGGRQIGDRCLYVSTGGFTKDARYEAERSNVPLTLLGLPDIRRLLVEHYDHVDTATRQLVPLTVLYWPVQDDS